MLWLVSPVTGPPVVQLGTVHPQHHHGAHRPVVLHVVLPDLPVVADLVGPPVLRLEDTGRCLQRSQQGLDISLARLRLDNSRWNSLFQQIVTWSSSSVDLSSTLGTWHLYLWPSLFTMTWTHHYKTVLSLTNITMAVVVSSVGCDSSDTGVSRICTHR